jgi:hypothetical protein
MLEPNKSCRSKLLAKTPCRFDVDGPLPPQKHKVLWTKLLAVAAGDGNAFLVRICGCERYCLTTEKHHDYGHCFRCHAKALKQSKAKKVKGVALYGFHNRPNFSIEPMA